MRVDTSLLPGPTTTTTTTTTTTSPTSATSPTSPAFALATRRRKLVLLVASFVVAAAALFALARSFPPIGDAEREHLRLPRSFEQVLALRRVLARYTHTHYYSVASLFAATFVFLQTFSVPGTIFFSFVSGSLFGFWPGFALVIAASTVGASLCYALSATLAHDLVLRTFPERIAQFRDALHAHRSHVGNYLLSLRISPLLPNWFINLASPILGVPYTTFAVATFFGIMPASFITVRAGMALYALGDADADSLDASTIQIFDAKSIVGLFVLAALALLPTTATFQRIVARSLLGTAESTDKTASD